MPNDVRDVVVLGFWARHQDRIRFVKILQAELRLGLAAAKRCLDAHLETGAPIVLAATASRAASLAASIDACGAEVRVASSRAEREEIDRALAAFFGVLHDGWDERAAAAARICPHLRP